MAGQLPKKDCPKLISDSVKKQIRKRPSNFTKAELSLRASLTMLLKLFLRVRRA